MLKTIIENLQKMAGFKLTFEFFKELFIGIIFGFGADYFFNNAGEWRLRIFTFGISIIIVFCSFNFIRKVKYNNLQKQAVAKLSEADCEYVLRCDAGEEYLHINNFSDYSNFEGEWEYILYVDCGKVVVLYEPYRIYAYSRAVRLTKKMKTRKNRRMIG